MGYVAHLQGNATHATPLLEESLALYRELGHKAGISDVLVGLGHVAYIQGDYQEAAARYEASMALRRERGDRRGSSAMLTCAGGAALAQGDVARAKARLMEGLALSSRPRVTGVATMALSCAELSGAQRSAGNKGTPLVVVATKGVGGRISTGRWGRISALLSEL